MAEQRSCMRWNSKRVCGVGCREWACVGCWESKFECKCTCMALACPRFKSACACDQDAGVIVCSRSALKRVAHVVGNEQATARMKLSSVMSGKWHLV